tara:strand:- start:329 stop:571 length:243 start_codon:yes stop_codon:yes gene_type:complete
MSKEYQGIELLKCKHEGHEAEYVECDLSKVHTTNPRAGKMHHVTCKGVKCCFTEYYYNKREAYEMWNAYQDPKQSNPELL